MENARCYPANGLEKKDSPGVRMVRRFGSPPTSRVAPIHFTLPLCPASFGWLLQPLSVSCCVMCHVTATCCYQAETRHRSLLGFPLILLKSTISHGWIGAPFGTSHLTA